MLDAKALQSTYDKLAAEHDVNLADFGVTLPPLKKRNGEYNNAALQLVYLYENMGQPCSRDDISRFVQKFSPTASGDQQPRQLKYKGWDIRLGGKSGDKHNGERVPNGSNVLACVDHASRSFIQNGLKRTGRLNARTWKEVLDAYCGKCAMCNRKCDVLEKGHMDPSKGSEVGNLLPVCGTCNNWASDRVVVGHDGRITALASATLVLESSDKVQLEIYLKLKRKFKV